MDIKDFERLTKLYIDSVYRVALNGCKSIADAEDVTQTVFVKLWQIKPEFEDDCHAKRWLIRVAVNECNSLWRSPWRKNTLPLEDLPKEPTFSTPDKSELYYAVKELPQKYRQVVHLYYYEGYSVKETAEILRISESAVQTRLLRARQYLKDRLKEAWQ